MRLIPYEDFEIGVRLLYNLKRLYVERKIYEYQKKNGTYPDSETTLSFYNIPEDVYERWKRGCYSRHYLAWKNEYDHYEEFIIDFDSDYSKIPFTIQALGSGHIAIFIQNSTMKYSVNGGEWMVAGKDGILLNVNENDRVSFVDVNTTFQNQLFNNIDVNFSVFGNIMSLIDGYAFSGSKRVRKSAFASLFAFNQRIVSAKHLVLPATILGDFCYSGMLYECQNLLYAPVKLPATRLSKFCYDGMFYDCVNLTNAPVLPAKHLAERCYWFMFKGCTSLTTAPKLPATTLEDGCYDEMFYNCTNLTDAPVLPAERLTDFCYYRMFSNCSSLQKIKAMFTSIENTGNALIEWTYQVAPTGVFIKNERATWDETADDVVPEGWTVETASA